MIRALASRCPATGTPPSCVSDTRARAVGDETRVWPRGCVTRLGRITKEQPMTEEMVMTEIKPERRCPICDQPIWGIPVPKEWRCQCPPPPKDKPNAK